ncbi:hypothetical protein CEXT_485111 [Caerostris extrusa]|uniref:Uncharacterized protein n=1 Tax=Caerostris extrusa TaxID=172846 RepID=A0AAV4Q4J8_CAEEX|nr:hypothetical protein CEXT_485111 [Caerostris extrusa]
MLILNQINSESLQKFGLCDFRWGSLDREPLTTTLLGGIHARRGSESFIITQKTRHCTGDVLTPVGRIHSAIQREGESSIAAVLQHPLVDLSLRNPGLLRLSQIVYFIYLMVLVS